MVSDVRDTLFDLRTEVTDTYDLAAIVRDFLTRVQQRTGIVTDHEVRIAGRLPLMQERELGQIAREPITNVAVTDSLSGRLEYVAGSAEADRDAVFTTQENEAGSLILRWEIGGRLLPGDSGTLRFQVRVR